LAARSGSTTEAYDISAKPGISRKPTRVGRSFVSLLDMFLSFLAMQTVQ
jgi:hypothetical protein